MSFEYAWLRDKWYRDGWFSDRTHPAVAEGAVVAAPDVRHGDVVAAVVMLKPGCELDLDGLRAYVAESGLVKQKTPELYVAEPLWMATVQRRSGPIMLTS